MLASPMQYLASLTHSPNVIQDTATVGWVEARNPTNYPEPNCWVSLCSTQPTSTKSTNFDSPNPKSAIQNLSPTSIGDPKSKISGIVLKESLIGAKVNGITGEQPSITKVNYFKGNDPSKWKTNVSTYDYVNLGEIYKGIELKLKAYGDNVEKLFCVKSGANPEQIKISLSGIQPSGNPPSLSPSGRGTGGCPPLAGAGGGLGARGLWVNEHGELVAETELGPVKFTKPIAYQEIDGERVEVSVEYSIQNPEDVGWVKRSAPNKNGLNQLNGLESQRGDRGSAIQNVEAEVSNPKSQIKNRKS